MGHRWPPSRRWFNPGLRVRPLALGRWAASPAQRPGDPCFNPPRGNRGVRRPLPRWRAPSGFRHAHHCTSRTRPPRRAGPGAMPDSPWTLKEPAWAAVVPVLEACLRVRVQLRLVFATYEPAHPALSSREPEPGPRRQRRQPGRGTRAAGRELFFSPRAPHAHGVTVWGTEGGEIGPGPHPRGNPDSTGSPRRSRPISGAKASERATSRRPSNSNPATRSTGSCAPRTPRA